MRSVTVIVLLSVVFSAHGAQAEDPVVEAPVAPPDAAVESLPSVGEAEGVVAEEPGAVALPEKPAAAPAARLRIAGPLEPGSPGPGPSGLASRERPAPPATGGDKYSPLFTAGIVTAFVGAFGIGLGGYFVYAGDRHFATYENAAAEGDEETYETMRNDVIPADRAGAISCFAIGGAMVLAGAAMIVADALGAGEKD